jgi:beta-glucosidase
MDRVEDLISRMTLEEKVSLVSGSGPWHTTPVPRLQIPRMKLSDGPNAVRGDGRSGSTAACFPVGSALGATWNAPLVEEVGAALAEEARSKDVQVVLGPTINLQRTPIGGRNFECYSEDPLLTGRLAVAFVRGLQAAGVGACPKHFVCNDTEVDRHAISSDVDERSLRELYLRPFELTVAEARPWSLMSAYNRVNGLFASSHRELLSGVLKQEWGFDGVVVSDWGASLETVENANGGLDLEMPGPARSMGRKLVDAVRAGRVAEGTVDDKVRRILRVLERSGRLDAPAQEAPEESVDRPAHRALARRAASESMVLLKNDGVLPLDAASLCSVAVIGPNAARGRIQGGGSSAAPPHHQVQPFEAIAARLGDHVRVVLEPGCSNARYAPAFDPARLRPGGEPGEGLLCEVFRGDDFNGEPEWRGIETRSRLPFFGAGIPGLGRGPFCARLSGSFLPEESGRYELGLASAGQSRLFVDGEERIDNWSAPERGETFYSFGSSERRAALELRAGEAVELRIEYRRPAGQPVPGLQFGAQPPLPADGVERAARAAAACDAAVVVVGTTADWESEGHDRGGLELPGRQAELVRAVCAANPRTVVVLNAGSPIETSWLAAAPAVLQAWFPGQEFGDALTDLLFGDACPSGRLPCSYPARLEDTPAFASYPGRDHHMPYAEGLLVGYRWYDTRGIEPRFPFGFGLSYTRFEYGPLEVAGEVPRGEAIRVALELRNAGACAGQEVVQLYTRELPPRPDAPLQELRAFAKVALAPGESRRVELVLDERALAHWDPETRGWRVEAEEVEIRVGASSRDLRSTARVLLR